MTSTIKDKGTVITDNIFKGIREVGGLDGLTITDSDASVGIQMSCNSESIIVNSCEFTKLCAGVRVAGVVDVHLGLSDIICEELPCMYSILSDAAVISLSGIQKYTSHTWKNPDTSAGASDVVTGVLFERMSGKLLLNTIIEHDSKSIEALTSLSGYLVDSIDPICRTPIQVTSLDQINNESDFHDTLIPGYMNVAISINVSGDITDLKFPSLNGQLVALYSPNRAVLKHNTNILCGEDIVLNQYTPVILQNKNGLWTRVA